MRKLLLRYIKRLARRQRGQAFFESLHRLALRGMNIGGGTDFEHSGELHVLASVRDMPTPWVVLDVGANRGGYALAARAALGDGARILCFEPSATAFAGLHEATAPAHIEAHRLALGDAPGDVPLYADKAGSELGSLYARDVVHLPLDFANQESVPVARLDAFCDEQHLDRISLLKIDAEGHELAVLRGAGEMLRTGAIQCIQFEFGGCNIDARVFFRDFFKLLTPSYRLYRITKHGLRAVPDYDESREQFAITNYVAKFISPDGRD